jgi:hypothetical protein
MVTNSIMPIFPYVCQSYIPYLSNIDMMWSEVSKDIFGKLILVYGILFLSHKYGFPSTVLFIERVL